MRIFCRCFLLAFLSFTTVLWSADPILKSRTRYIIKTADNMTNVFNALAYTNQDDYYNNIESIEIILYGNKISSGDIIIFNSKKEQKNSKKEQKNSKKEQKKIQSFARLIINNNVINNFNKIINKGQYFSIDTQYIVDQEDILVSEKSIELMYNDVSSQISTKSGTILPGSVKNELQKNEFPTNGKYAKLSFLKTKEEKQNVNLKDALKVYEIAKSLMVQDVKKNDGSIHEYIDMPLTQYLTTNAKINNFIEKTDDLIKRELKIVDHSELALSEENYPVWERGGRIPAKDLHINIKNNKNQSVETMSVTRFNIMGEPESKKIIYQTQENYDPNNVYSYKFEQGALNALDLNNGDERLVTLDKNIANSDFSVYITKDELVPIGDGRFNLEEKEDRKNKERAGFNISDFVIKFGPLSAALYLLKDNY